MSSTTPTSPGFPLGAATAGGYDAAASSSQQPLVPLASPRAMALAASSSRPVTPIGGHASLTTPSTPGSLGATTPGGSTGGVAIEEVKRWVDADVSAWLTSHRLGQHSATFAKNDITGHVLLDVDQNALKEMGITAVGDRIRIFSAIKALKKQCIQTAQMAQSARNAALARQARILAQQEGEMETLSNAGSDTSRPRPPPLRLSGSAASNVPATPPCPSPSSQHGLGLGLSQARGLTPGNRQPNPANVGQGRSPVPATMQPSSLTSTSASSSPQMTHRKTNSAVPGTFAQRNPSSTVQQRPFGSYGGTTSAGSNGRPATAGGTYSGGGGQHAHAHAVKVGQYGAPVSSSPTSSTFGPSAGTRSVRPETADAALTPITENIDSYSPSTPSASNFHIGRAGKPGAGSTASLTASPAPPTLEDLKRRTIKFIGDDGTTRIVNVSDCRDAHDVLARVLRKFGKSASANSYPPTLGQSLASPSDAEHATGEKYVIVATNGEGATRDLKPEELLAICHAPQPYDPLRERGLSLRRISPGGASQDGSTSSRRIARAGRNKLEAFFGERVQDGSPGQNAAFLADDPHNDAGHVTTAGKKMNRASTVSIMSGLGAGALQAIRRGEAGGSNSGHGSSVAGPSAASGSARSKAPSSDTASTNTNMSLPRRARNFMGQRPPSELISSHLADYFPATEKKVLERTARRSIYGRASSSIRSSKRDSTWSFAGASKDDEEPPPLPTKGDDTATIASRSTTLDVPDLAISRPRNVRRISSGRASIDSSRSHTNHRPSYASQLRAARGLTTSGSGAGTTGSASLVDRSDAASMLTVDEITQEVESRRESRDVRDTAAQGSAAGGMAGWVVDEDGVPIPLAGTRTRGAKRKSTVASSMVTGGDVASMVTVEEDDSTRPSSGINSDASSAAEASETGDTVASSKDTTSIPAPANVVLDRPSPAVGTTPGDEDEDEEDESFDEDDELDDEDDDDDEDDEDGVAESDTPAAPAKQPIKWIKGALIGAGSFGSVYLGMNAKSGLLMAVKQVELPSGQSQNDQKKKRMLDALEGEIELLKTLQHDNIVQYLDSYGDGTHLNIFLEYVPGGSVVALLRNYGAFEEPLVRNFVKQILKGLNFLHNKDIVHRDIKGANILVDNKSCIKISDFGISKKVESDLLANARAHRPSLQGSVFWMAPEVVKQTSYTRKADIWSLGCLVVEMMSGTHPWPNLNQMQALFKIGSSSKPSMPDEISKEAVDFLEKTFEIDHEKRPEAEELLSHAFITAEEGEGTSGEATVGESTLESSGSASGGGSTIETGDSALTEGSTKVKTRAKRAAREAAAAAAATGGVK